jgi:hypothetical protein
VPIRNDMSFLSDNFITRAYRTENIKTNTVLGIQLYFYHLVSGGASIVGSTSGALIGSVVFPVFGTIVGGLVGGAVGGLVFGVTGAVLTSEYNNYRPVKFGSGMYSTLNSKIIKKEHPKYGGYGLFATAKIHKGEVVWREDKQFEDTPEYSFDEINKWPEEKRKSWTHFAYQISETHMKGPDSEKEVNPDHDAANFYNHSCDPTTWYDSYKVITARRDIEEGEEITYDYCTSELQETKLILDCGCGTKACRHKITRNDWKIPELQEKYKGHFLQHVQYLIDKSKTEEKSEKK